MTPTSNDARTHLAWLLWCVNEGYTNAEDRAIMTNWFLEDPAQLHADDLVEREHLLGMADEVLAALARETSLAGRDECPNPSAHGVVGA